MGLSLAFDTLTLEATQATATGCDSDSRLVGNSDPIPEEAGFNNDGAPTSRLDGDGELPSCCGFRAVKSMSQESVYYEPNECGGYLKNVLLRVVEMRSLILPDILTSREPLAS